MKKRKKLMKEFFWNLCYRRPAHLTGNSFVAS